MADWKEKLGKLGFADVISPTDFPEAPIEGHPTPWIKQEAGNGHFYVYDSEGKELFHVYCWDDKDWKEFGRKLELINGATQQ